MGTRRSEERDRAAGVPAEELEVPGAGAEDLDAVVVGQRELGGRRLLERDAQAEHVAQEGDHRLLVRGPHAKPGQPQDPH
jgi:hypothetical protein